MQTPLKTSVRNKDAYGFFRLPLEGRIDLTYRCNNHCRHCWLWMPDTEAEQRSELTFAEIRRIVDEARTMGCRSWGISGGEPLLREDFPEIFDYITRKSVTYNIATNGTLITPVIANLLARKGTRLVSLYGATAEVYDHVTRNPGAFAKAMQGISYLKEAGVSFVVLMVPMKDNWHEWNDMILLGKKLSPYLRIGAPWFYQSCGGTVQQKSEIAAQRLQPRDIINLNKPYAADTGQGSVLKAENAAACGAAAASEARLFANCISKRKEFHIDPYGKMSWCMYIKDPALRFDLRRGTFAEAWDKFIPSCADGVRGNQEWRENCAACAKRDDCRWCAAYAYLETGRYSAPIPYLCDVTEEARTFKKEWQDKHRRYFQIAGITIQLESNIDYNDIKFKDELAAFAVDAPGDDNVLMRHHFTIPELKNKDLGEVIYRKRPWAISRKDGTWFYRNISADQSDGRISRIAVFNADHTRANIYNPPGKMAVIQAKGWDSLSLFPTDQIWLTSLLANRDAVLLHAAAAIVNGQGLLFVGHSDAGKSTTMEMLKDAHAENMLQAEVLCDDRNIIRKWPDGWKVHGTWSHGTTADVSPSSARLKAILLLEQAKENKITIIADRKLIWRRLLATLIRSVVTAKWWQKELDILEQIIDEVPCYTMQFDKSGKIVTGIEKLTR